MKIRKQTIIALTFLLNSALGIAQSPIMDLDIHDKKVAYFLQLEQQLGSEKFNTGQTYLSRLPVAQPAIFKRSEKNLPDLLVYYTFFKKDSTISEILYEWDVYNFDKKDSTIQSIEFEKNLIVKYNQIIDFITSKYGKSDFKGNLNDLSLINDRQGLKRNDTWMPNDSLKITSYIVISNYYKKSNFVTINPTHKIRVYLNNLKPMP